MLPTLSSIKKSTQQQFQASEIKLYNPPRELSSMQHFQNQRKQSLNSSSRHNQSQKVRAAGFKKSDGNNNNNNNTNNMNNISESSIKKQRDSILLLHKASLNNTNHEYPSHNNYNNNNYSTSMNPYNSNPKQQFFNPSNIKLPNSAKDLSAQIKLIQKKIRYHKKKLQEQKKKKQQNERIKNDPYSKDFQRIIQKQMEIQGYAKDEENRFDYLTNPNKNQQQQEEQEQQPQPQQLPQPQPPVKQKKFIIQQRMQKLQKHYQQNLRKKFERREMFPHFACKRKTPKLYITSQTNTLQKFGKRPNQQQHIFRVMTKQCTPQEIYPTIPQFSVVKDSLARNVLAYLGDYKPFLEKTKEDGSLGDEQENRDNNNIDNNNNNINNNTNNNTNTNNNNNGNKVIKNGKQEYNGQNINNA